MMRRLRLKVVNWVVALSLLAGVGQSLVAEEVNTVSTRYRGYSSFFAGSPQYKVFYCKTADCSEPQEGLELSFAARLGFAEKALEQTNKAMRAYYYRMGVFEEVTSGLDVLKIHQAIDLARDPDGNFGDPLLSTTEVQKLSNYLHKNAENIAVYLADFGMTGWGDGSASFIAIYNARTSWFTYVQFAEYSE